VHELDIILTLAGALTAALVFGLVAQKLRLSPIVGYLAAGVAIGPFTPGFVAQTDVASQFAELGVVLLMFGVGLNLHLRELLAVKSVALPGAALGMLVATGAGAAVARAFGWSLGSSIVFGLALSVSSTVVLLRVFGEAGIMHAPVGHVAVGWLLVEDLCVVLVLVLLPILASPNATSASGLAVAVGVAVAKLVALAVFTLAFGKRAIPWLLAEIARTRSRELFTLTVLVMAIGVAVLAAKLFGASMALGAFLAGLVVGQSEFAARAASDALPMRDAFAVVFFVATGMLLDPSRVVSTLPMTLATVAVVVLAKPLAAAIVTRALRRPTRTALGLAAGLGQIGEFSFVLAALGRKLGVLPEAATQALVMTSIVTITASPLLVRLAQPTKELAEKTTVDAAYRAIVVGYGPIGKSLVRLLVAYGIEPTVIEMNEETARAIAGRGIASVHGDASNAEILERAGAREAGSFLFTSSAPAEASVRAARELNPKMLILTRSAYAKGNAALEKAGASEVVDTEGELALAFTERLLRKLGASADELDRARDRVRREVEEAS
jgi:CPA2 family monovalent cation:H+ antiporter-2